MNTSEKIQEILRRELRATRVEVTDQSDLHAGHQQASGGGHYNITVVSPLFEGKKMIERHRMIYQSLAKELQREIHALAIRAYSIPEFKESGG